MFLIPFICFLTSIAISKKLRAQSILNSFFILCISQYAALFLICKALALFAADWSGSLPLLPVLTTCMLPYAAALQKDLNKDGKPYRYLKTLCIASCAVFLLEIFVMNGNSLTQNYQAEALELEDIRWEGEVEEGPHYLRITGDATLILEDVPSFARCVTIPLKQRMNSDALPYFVKLTMRDDNFPNTAITVQEKKQMGRQVDCRLCFQPYGKTHSLEIKFSKLSTPVTLKRINAASCLPFRFLSIRFFILLAAIAFVSAAIEFSWHTIRYDRKKPAHVICVGAVIAACMCLCYMFSRPGVKPYDYTDTPSTRDPYALVFDALQHGQLWLDITPDENLKQLENVYSRDQRNAAEVSPLWDYAYHDGKYYCYFGITPVLLYYEPYYLIHDKLPTLSMAITFFSVWSVLFFCLALLSAIRMFTTRPNLLLTLLSLPAATLCVGVCYMMNYGDMYHLPFVCGLCMLSICLLTGIKACMAKPLPVRMLLFFVSGASLALCAGARPSVAISAAVLIPLYLGILLNRRQKLSCRLGQAACFLAPLFAGIGGLMWYNQARFGSVFDFGAAYQLTVSDVHANRFRLSYFWGVLSHYFSIAPQHTPTFPFFEPQYGHLNNYQQFVYLEGTIGWFRYPLIVAGLLCVYPALAGDRIRCRRQITLRQRRAFLLTGIATAFLIAWLDFSAGGVNQRYLYDLAPILLLCCLAAILRTCPAAGKNRYLYLVLCAVVIVTWMFSSLYLLGITNGNLMRHCPDLYNAIEEMVMFWQ